jgi:hypothetical protein
VTSRAPSADPAVAAAEAWFIKHGLPYFVDGERAAVRQGLRPRRLIPALVGSALLGVAVGILLGLVTDSVSLGIGSAMTFAGIGALLYGLTALRVWPIVRWAVVRTLKSLGLLFPLVTRALPLLLLFVTFLFINAEVWQVSANLDGGVMWVTILLFAGLTVGFLLARLPEELDRVDDEVATDRLVAVTRGTPLADAARMLADSKQAVERDEAEVHGFQKANLLLVLLVAQFVQVLLLSSSVFLFFIVFGVVAMKEEVIVGWTAQKDLAYPFGETMLVSTELIQVSVFLAAFSGLYFTVYAVTDEIYRTQFFTSITNELERAVGARTVYQYLKSGGLRSAEGS